MPVLYQLFCLVALLCSFMGPDDSYKICVHETGSKDHVSAHVSTNYEMLCE